LTIILAILSSGLLTGAISSYLTYLGVKNKSETELKAQKDKYEGEIKLMNAEQDAQIKANDKEFEIEMGKLVIESIINSMPETKKSLDDQLAKKLKNGELDIVEMFK